VLPVRIHNGRLLKGFLGDPWFVRRAVMACPNGMDRWHRTTFLVAPHTDGGAMAGGWAVPDVRHTLEMCAKGKAKKRKAGD
jgi:hypothetical protein